MTVTDNELIIAQNLDSKLQKIGNKVTNLYKTVEQYNNNLNYNIKSNDKPLQILNNIRGKSVNDLKKDKPQFITTVKSGVFLEPPHEIAILLGLSTEKKTKSSPSSNNSLNSAETLRVPETPLVMYSYSSRPKILNNRNCHANCVKRKRSPDCYGEIIREDKRDGNLPYGNIMFDRRVVRGCTYAAYPLPTEGFESLAEKRREARRRALARKKAKGYCVQGRMGTPPPVQGRKHEPIQTERYLEELFDRPLETEAACQTDLFLDRPATPLYVPAKTGIDQDTQIWPGELFDFDTEVVPILEVLVGKTVEQALVEVLEEEEIADLRAQQQRFLELRNAEKAEEQRLEEEEKRLAEEKERRMAEHEKALKLQKETEERVAAAMLSEGYIADLVPNVLEGLKDAGFLVDEIRSDVGNNFMPWLMDELRIELKKMISSRDILGEIIREILEAKADTYTKMGDYFEGENQESLIERTGWPDDFFSVRVSRSCNENVPGKMSAFTPYKKVEKLENGDKSPADLRERKDGGTNGFSIDMTSVLFNLSSFQRNVLAAGYFDTRRTNDIQVEKNEKFFIKNILRNDDNEKKQRTEKKRLEFEEQASKMETLVSNLGKSEDGHRCIYCGKIYSRKYGLKIHIRTHTGYKPLKCKYCLRPFGDPSNLNKHVRLHARGYTPYNCQFCGKILVRRRDLERHVKSKHGESS